MLSLTLLRPPCFLCSRLVSRTLLCVQMTITILGKSVLRAEEIQSLAALYRQHVQAQVSYKHCFSRLLVLALLYSRYTWSHPFLMYAGSQGPAKARAKPLSCVLATHTALRVTHSPPFAYWPGCSEQKSSRACPTRCKGCAGACRVKDSAELKRSPAAACTGASCA